MAFTQDGQSTDSRTSKTRSKGRGGSPDFLTAHDDWDREHKQPRDWKKVALVIGLGALSWVATYVGMLELIQANMGDLPLLQKAVIGFAVAMLMTMIIWLLDQLFASHNFFTKLSYVAGYMFLTLISVGFGFGFYWKVLESRSEATRSAESAISQVQSSLHGASTRLDQLQMTLEGLAIISKQKAIEERTRGTSCPNSSPGDGPRRKLRDDDAARFAFSSQFVKGRAGAAKTNMQALNADMQKVVKNAKSTFDAKTGTRNEFMRSLNRKLNLTVTGFNAFRTDPQLKQIRTDLAARAGQTTFPNGKGGNFSCPDAQLQAALRGVVRAIDQLPELQKPKIATVEGSEAVIEAFRRLTTTLYGALQFKLPPTPEELRELQQKAVQSVSASRRQAAPVDMEGAGLSKRDYVPLAIAFFVDLCLLLVSMGRPMNRLDNLVPKMRRAERGPVIQILSRFNEIHKDEEVRENFEIFRHVVFDWGGDYYVAVPMNAPYTANQNLVGGHYRRVNNHVEELQQEAHLLANLFASFEKEKIFSRVLVPLLSTRAIQKKLHKQGSKFAGAESFRVYKFRDGAWSEIILGAVMGAARRVEADKRRRRVEDDIFEAQEPTFEQVAQNSADKAAAEQRAKQAANAGDSSPEATPFDTAAHNIHRPEDALHLMGEVGAKIAAHDVGGAAHTGQPQPATEERGERHQPAHWAEPAAAHGQNGGANRPKAAPQAPAFDDAAVARFGPYGLAATAELGAATQGTPLPGASRRPAPMHPAASAANNNTAPLQGGSGFAHPAQSAQAETAPLPDFARQPDQERELAKVIHLPYAQTAAAAQAAQPAATTFAASPEPAAPTPATPVSAAAPAMPQPAVNQPVVNQPVVSSGIDFAIADMQNIDATSLVITSPALADIPVSAAGLPTDEPAVGEGGAQGPMINVEMRERSVTYAIPAQEAALPSQLFGNGPVKRSLTAAIERTPFTEVVGEPIMQLPQHNALQMEAAAEAAPVVAAPEAMVNEAVVNEAVVDEAVALEMPPVQEPAASIAPKVEIEAEAIVPEPNAVEAAFDQQQEIDAATANAAPLMEAAAEFQSEDLAQAPRFEPIDAYADEFAMTEKLDGEDLGDWGDEASVEINTSEISRRFAPGAKKD